MIAALRFLVSLPRTGTVLLGLGEDCLPCKPRSVDLDSLQGLQVYVNNASLGGKPILPPSPYAWVLMERRKLLCTMRSPGNLAVQLIPSAPISNLKRWTKSHRRHLRGKTKKAGIEWRGTVDHAGDRNREAQCAGPVVALLFRGKTQETGSAWTRLYRVYLFCVLVWLRQKRNVSYTLLDFESRGDGLEPSASAVTGNRGKVSQQLARSRGLPNTA